MMPIRKFASDLLGFTMRVYQGTWDSNGRFLFWGEEAATFNDIIANAHSGEYDSENILGHPYSCSIEQITQDLDSLEFSADAYGTINVLLPSDSLGPCSSPLLVPGHEIQREGQPFAKPWNIPVAIFEPFAAACFLTSLPSEEPVGTRFAPSIKYWLEATKFILELLCRGRFIPNLTCTCNFAYSSWQLVPNLPEDLDKIKILCRAMPQICRACNPKGNNEFNPAEPLLDSFIATVGDSLIRIFLKNHPLLLTEGISPLASDKHALAKKWLRSLTATSGIIDGDSHELTPLAERLKLWSSRILSGVKRSELHLGFCLISEDDENESIGTHQWKITFFLYLDDDISQRLYPYQIWNGETSFLKNSEYTPEQVGEIFLKELGRASVIIPQLKATLFESHPTQITIRTEQAYEFLKYKVAILEQAGFGVIVPDWWKQPKINFGLKLSVDPATEEQESSKSFRQIGINQLLSCSWEFVIGNHSYSLTQFKDLIQKYPGLLKVDNDWIELNPEKLAATFAFLEAPEKSSKMTILDALRFGYGIDNDLAMLPIAELVANGWVKQLIASAGQEIPKLPRPEGFQGELRHYQEEGLSWMYFLANLGVGYCLADDMGLGKTIQFISLLLQEKQAVNSSSDEQNAPINLLIVPMSILENWQRELQHFAPSVNSYLHHGMGRLTGHDFLQRCAHTDLVITTYNIAYRDLDLLSQVTWVRIALDEAQNIKNLTTKQTQAIRKLIQQQLADANRSTVCQRVALTGTPLENHLDELWSIMDFLNPGYLGTIRNFRSNYSIPIERYRSKETAGALSRVVRPFILRRLKSDPNIISDLPEKLEMVENIHLTEEQLDLYQRTFENMLPKIETADGIHRKGLVLTTIVRLKQICNHPNLIRGYEGLIANRSGKLNRLVELLETILDTEDKVLIFTQFAQMGTILKSYLQERFSQDVLFLHGALSRTARASMVDRFQQKDGPKVFILSLKAGGFGLNLTEANQVIHYDQWWNPAVENQATDRAFRIGQKRNVQVRKFICRGTLEEKIAAMLGEKQALADNIVSSTRSELIRLSSEELKNLLKLSHHSLITEDEE
ncbi:MAG: DEAD/DEAH box helicase [Deltaproteobacteria bacterium]|nr:DEAD/DEAH box helicase [Deltaproteobacteria bacterium]